MEISKKILEIQPYQTGKPIEEAKRELGLQSVFKLASNENPLGPSPLAVEAMTRALGDLHRYPDGSCYELGKAMSQYLGVDRDWLIFGNGSNELIDLVLRLFCGPGDLMVTSQAAFIAYKLGALAARLDVVEIPMSADFKFDIKAFSSYFAKPLPHKMPQNKVVFISNPNNPTGTYLTRDELEQFLAQVGDRPDVVVVLDEAYFEYARAADYPDGRDYVRKYSNVVVLRTMSKVFGLAGLRLGILIARPEVIGLINRIRNPFNVNTLAQVATPVALKDVEHIERSKRLVWDGLDFFYSKLSSLGLPFAPSQGNFVFFDTQRDAAGVSEALLRKGVIVRPIGAYGFKRHLRLTVGLPPENQLAMDSLREIITS